ncbi:ABC transporter permease [Weissella confusa]|uniref:ABC transporter permease n=1 Tax=Weissella confusa TaxID=1583 RepID=UPI000704C9E1|nr:ABC transporter permease [Weissella confusa]KRN21885.1 ABC transporter permease [Weissella confusa]MBJ7699694.1 FtsX-like permease family protein [Weissella confusa]MBS7551835.1 ABC transporter permease [Weissella confusa]MCQ8097667.1 ABC transporter permease [Weissella confusa]MCQ8147074.1 ABC transporter permease [Weissella confusa]
MDLWGIIKSSWQSLITNKRRSILTMLGIIIGIASVITILSIGNGVNKQMAKFVSADKSGMIKETIYYTQDDYYANGLDQSDVNTIKNSPYADKIANIKLKRLENGSTTLDGYAGEQKVSNLNAKVVKGSGDVELVTGRKLTKDDNALAQRNVTIADDFAKKYFGSAHAAVDQAIELGGLSYTVVGVVKMGADSQMEMPAQVWLPYNTFLGTQTAAYPMVQLTIATKDKPGKVAQKVTDYLQKNGSQASSGKYQFEDEGATMASLQKYVSVIALFVSAVAGISLFIAGIGVMNMMYISVSERTQEIGIRLAVGATERHVLLQFLIEAVMLTLSGGVIGLAMGAGLGKLITVVMDNPNITAVVTMNNVLMVFGVTTAIGIIFGWLPARQASRKNLIEILR